jgi:predicted RNA-binding protein associated with RNAse of E/G family
VVWFTYPGRWHDIGRFHRADGSFTGYYANVLTPVLMTGDRWETTDLCLDVWLGADGRVELLDEEEFAEAVERGWMDAPTARAARHEAEALAEAARAGAWPPPEVRAWDLARARAATREGLL